MKIVGCGHSNINTLAKAWAREINESLYPDITFCALSLHGYRIPGITKLAYTPEGLRRLRRDWRMLRTQSDINVYCPHAFQFNTILFAGHLSQSETIRFLESSIPEIDAWLELLHKGTKNPAMLLSPPPPIGNDAEIFRLANESTLGRLLQNRTLRSPESRQKVWLTFDEMLRDLAEKRGFVPFKLPDSVFSKSGIRAEDCISEFDATHGNDQYGARVLDAVIRTFSGHSTDQQVHAPRPYTEWVQPYKDLPDSAFWQQSISTVKPGQIRPIVARKFRIRKGEKVASAGSCFAQHIAKSLKENGFNYLTTEISDSNNDQPLFSARYGNIYTAKQLLQLFQRAFGEFDPNDKVWKHPDGGFCDPFRPRIEPVGYSTPEEVLAAQQKHLKAVRELFEQLDVFIFTLGLTEAWQSRIDEATYPLAPGVAGGKYYPAIHQFKNFSAAEVTSDLQEFISALKKINTNAKIILTVSPVPLVATAEAQHVLTSTFYSKSVLRVAAEEVCREHDHVQYFPSYEMINGPQAPKGYYCEDKREISELAIKHVMRTFNALMTVTRDTHVQALSVEDKQKNITLEELEAGFQAECEEELLRR